MSETEATPPPAGSSTDEKQEVPKASSMSESRFRFLIFSILALLVVILFGISLMLWSLLKTQSHHEEPKLIESKNMTHEKIEKKTTEEKQEKHSNLKDKKDEKDKEVSSNDHDKDKEGDENKEEDENKEIVYDNFAAPFVFDLSKASGESSFLQVEITVGSKEAEVLSKIKEHDPRIRNDLLELFSAQSMGTLTTKEGKDFLRESARKRINQILVEEGVKNDLKELLFTKYIIQ